MVDSAKDSQTYGSADGGKEILHHNLSANNSGVRDAIVETDCKVVLLFRVWLDSTRKARHISWSCAWWGQTKYHYWRGSMLLEVKTSSSVKKGTMSPDEVHIVTSLHLPPFHASVSLTSYAVLQVNPSSIYAPPGHHPTVAASALSVLFLLPYWHR